MKIYLAQTSTEKSGTYAHWYHLVLLCGGMQIEVKSMLNIFNLPHDFYKKSTEWSH